MTACDHLHKKLDVHSYGPIPAAKWAAGKRAGLGGLDLLETPNIASVVGNEAVGEVESYVPLFLGYLVSSS